MNWEEDAELFNMNKTELLGLVRTQKRGLLRKSIDFTRLVAIAAGYIEPTQDDLASTVTSRKKLQVFIQTNIKSLANQLPGCNGMCTTFPCSEGRHVLCFLPNSEAVA